MKDFQYAEIYFQDGTFYKTEQFEYKIDEYKKMGYKIIYRRIDMGD